jgi:hypothetical protein
MKLQAFKRKSIREHRQMHLDRASAMREEANRIMAYLASHSDNMPEYAIQDAEKTANDLKAQAIAEENGKCMEDAPHG